MPVNQGFVTENGKETLAQVFTDVRYTRKDNEAISHALTDALVKQGFLKPDALRASLEVVETRPEVLECDVVRFQNKKEKWWPLWDCSTVILMKSSPV